MKKKWISLLLTAAMCLSLLPMQAFAEDVALGASEEIVEEVLSQYVMDAVETASLWCDYWEEEGMPLNVPLPREAIVDAISSIRRFVFGASGERRSMFSVLAEINRNQEVFSRACSEICNTLSDRAAVERLHSSFNAVKIDSDPKYRDMGFKFVVLGIIGLMDSGKQQYDDDTIANMLCGMGLKMREASPAAVGV